LEIHPRFVRSAEDSCFAGASGDLVLNRRPLISPYPNPFYLPQLNAAQLLQQSAQRRLLADLCHTGIKPEGATAFRPIVFHHHSTET
jgi:hypothetical protein